MFTHEDEQSWKSQASSWHVNGRTIVRGLHKGTLYGACALIVLFFWQQRYKARATTRTAGWDSSFQPRSLTGYINSQVPDNQACNSKSFTHTIYTSASLHLQDDIQSIARTLEAHPRIDYSAQNPNLTHDELIDKTWVRMAQSSVWLDKFQVYLTVTRIVFYDKGGRQWAVMSFLRGQIHDQDWNELQNYTLEWQGRRILFPKMFDIPSPYIITDPFFGPEDPRLIIEQDLPEAEPVIVFNMISDTRTKQRSMYIFRPFSGSTTVLKIRGRNPEQAEKNWMPFYYGLSIGKKDSLAVPNQHLHFLYRLEPLQVLKCHIHTGLCDFVYKREAVTDRPGRGFKDEEYALRGGSNLYAIKSLSGREVYVGFPRTHIDDICEEAVYRPELMILSSTSETYFDIDYVSAPLDLGDAATEQHSVSGPCTRGRILIVNNIARWNAELDVMTLSFSEDDSTTQVLMVGGVGRLVQSVIKATTTGERSGAGGQAILDCALEAADEHAVDFAAATSLST